MKFDVYISKDYFPKDKRGDQFNDRYKSWKVDADSREEAAQKVWGAEGEALLKEMIPYSSQLPRRVSLYVNDPQAPGNSGTASRLIPIRVFGKTKRRGQMKRMAKRIVASDSLEQYWKGLQGSQEFAEELEYSINALLVYMDRVRDEYPVSEIATVLGGSVKDVEKLQEKSREITKSLAGLIGGSMYGGAGLKQGSSLADRDNSPECGMPTAPMPEDAKYEERLCNRCYEKWEKGELS